MDKRRQRRGNLALIKDFSLFLGRSSFARGNFVRCIPPPAIVFRRCGCQMGPNCLFRSQMVGKQSVPDARPGGILLAWMQSVGWRCGFCLRRCCNRSPDASPGIFWLGESSCCASFHKDNVNSSKSGSSAPVRRATCVTSRLKRIHAVSA